VALETGEATEIALSGAAGAGKGLARLYLVNARFTSPRSPDTTFNAIAVSV